MITAVAVIRDEVDIVARTVGHLSSQVDRIIVADNGSTDGTRDILRDLGVDVIDDDVRAFYQAAKVTHLARKACAEGATWVVPFDADELWQAPPGQTIRTVLEAQPPDVKAVGAVFWDHVPTDADDPTITDPIERLGWRQMRNGPLLRVAARAHPEMVIEDGNHFVSHDDGFLFAWPQLAVRHYSLRSFDQFAAKVDKVTEALAVADLHPAIATHWRQWAHAAGNPVAARALWEGRVHRNPADDFTLTYDPPEVN